VGASLGGTGITVDRHKNSLYYDNFAATTFQMVEGDNVTVPPEAARLKAVLTMITDPPAAEADDDATRDPKVSRSSKVRRQADAADDRPVVRSSTRRRRPALEEGDEAAAPRDARSATRGRPPAGADEPASDDLPPPTRVRPIRRPEPDDGSSEVVPAAKPR